MSALAVAPDTRVSYGSQLEIDLAAVAANARFFAARTTASLMAVVKADGFGHGAVDVARTALAHGATSLGVTSITEALELRAAGLRAPVLSWLNPVDAEFAAASAADVELAVASHEHLDAVVRACRQSAPTAGPARVHLHLDTGMARDGAEPSAWPALCRASRRAERDGLVRVVGVMGHLGCADDPSDECNVLGRQAFDRGVEIARAAGLRPTHRHLAATAATLTDRRNHHTMVRIGAGLLQEMLTNAIKHGRRDTTVMVERHWEGELRIEVRNVIRSVEVTPPPEPALTGQGIEGMRHRLQAVGGRLDVRLGEETAGPTFTATAWMPIRAVA